MKPIHTLQVPENREGMGNMSILRKFYKTIAATGQPIVVSLLLIACQATTYTDATNVATVQRLTVPEAEYRDVAWLDEDTIAFVYRLPEFGDQAGDFRIATYILSNHVWQDIPRPELPDNCSHAPAMPHDLNLLPNSNLGYTLPCSNLHDGISGMLYEWDREANVFHQLQSYDPPFAIGPYAFAPDMSQLIQEERVGAGLNNELYRVNRNGEMTRLFPDYQRARSPSWSPDGELIAFSATETYPKRTNDPKIWGQIEDLLFYPWDLYLMNADGSDVRILLPEAGRPYQLKWSPDSQFLAYAGDSQDSKGLWILDIDSLELVRVWPENTFYDWSPDGTQMVVIAQEKEGDVTKTYPVIIDLTLPGP